MNQPTKPPDPIDLLSFQRVGFYVDQNGEVAPVDSTEADRWSKFVNEWIKRTNRADFPGPR